MNKISAFKFIEKNCLSLNVYDHESFFVVEAEELIGTKLYSVVEQKNSFPEVIDDEKYLQFVITKHEQILQRDFILIGGMNQYCPHHIRVDNRILFRLNGRKWKFVVTDKIEIFIAKEDGIYLSHESLSLDLDSFSDLMYHFNKVHHESLLHGDIDNEGKPTELAIVNYIEDNGLDNALYHLVMASK